MNFKQFLEVQLIKQNPKAIYLGKFAWWNVWIDFSGGPLELGGGLEQAQSMFEEAARRLARIGMKRMNANCLITKESTKNHITGGGVAGTAYIKSHGFTVSSLDIETTIHEHAHMFWFNMPRHKQLIFIDWYNKNVMSYKPTGKELSRLDQSPDIYKIKSNIIENSWDNFVNNFSDIKGITIESFLKPATNFDQRVIRILLSNFRDIVRGWLKKELVAYRINGEPRTLKEGEKVYIEKGADKFLIGSHFNDIRYETVIEENEILTLVRFDQKLLHEDQLEKIENYSKPIKKFTFFTTPKEKIIEIAKTAINNIVKYHYHHESIIINNISEENFYSHWYAMIRMRSGKINSVQDLKKTYINAMEKSLYIDITDSKQNYHQITGRNSLDAPRYSKFRDILAQNKIVPTGYAASNSDELFAELITYVTTGTGNAADAMSRNRSQYKDFKELKKLLYQIL